MVFIAFRAPLHFWSHSVTPASVWLRDTVISQPRRGNKGDTKMTQLETQATHPKSADEKLVVTLPKSTHPRGTDPDALIPILILGAITMVPSIALFIGTFCTYGIRDGLIVSMLFGLFMGFTSQLGRIPFA